MTTPTPPLTTRGLPRKSNAGRKPSAAGPLVNIGEVLVSPEIAALVESSASDTGASKSAIVHAALTETFKRRGMLNKPAQKKGE